MVCRGQGCCWTSAVSGTPPSPWGVIQGKTCGVLRWGNPAGADSGTAEGGQARGPDTAQLCGTHRESASKDKRGHPSASGPRLGRVPDPRPSPQGAPKHPQHPGRGSDRAAGRQGDWAVRDTPPSHTSFLPKGRAASGGPSYSAPQAGIHLPWSLLPGAAGSSAGYLPEAVGSHLWLPWQPGTLPPQGSHGLWQGGRSGLC